MARLTAEQQQNLATILKVGRRMGASKKALKAAVEAGLVESSLRNLGYGDRDSVGVFQQRPSQGWKGLTNVAKAAEEFYAQAIPLSKKYGTAGQLAQAVQRSAFPGRYDQQSGVARQLLRGNVSSGSAGKLGSPASSKTDYQSSDNTALALSLLGVSSDYGLDPLQLALTAALQKAPTSRVSRSKTASAPSSGGSGRSDLYHLAKVGQKKFGLDIREFAPFDKVDPVHVKGSYHYSGRAFDASGSAQQMAAFDRYLVKKHGKSLKELFYDPGVSIKNGQRTGSIGHHSDHVHVAL